MSNNYILIDKKSDITLNASYLNYNSMDFTYYVGVNKSIAPEIAISNAHLTDGIPKFGESVANNHLYAYDFTSKISEKKIGDNSYLIEVSVKFAPFHKLENNYIMSFRSSMSTKQAITDYMGQPAIVEYTYPDTENTVSQICPYEKFQPTFEITTTGISSTHNPLQVVIDWQGATNADTFQGIYPGQLLCTSVNYEPFNSDPYNPQYRFQFVFQGNIELWHQLIFFKDNDTGNIPNDLVYGTGYKYIQVYKIINFNDTFPFKVNS